MNINNYKGRKSLSNLGMSPILIVVVVLLVLVLGGVGYGYYVYSTNPFLRVYDSYVKLNNVKEIKNFEIGGEVSGTFNLGKLIKEQPSSSSLVMGPELKVLDRDSNMKYSLNAKYNNENQSVLGSVNVNLQNFVMPEPIGDSINGDVLGMDIYAKGINNKSGVFDVVAFKLTKLPNIKSPLSGDELNLENVKNTWVDMSAVYKNPSSSVYPGDTRKAVTKVEVKPINSFLTCEKKTLSFYQRFLLARAGTKLFSKAENKGQVDYDGGKATKLTFEVDSKNKSAMIEALDEMSKIACTDSSNLQNDKLVEALIKGLSLSKLTVDYMVDSKTGFPAKIDTEFNLTYASLKSSVSIKNINNTTFDEPKDLMPVEKFLQERWLPILSPSNGRMNNNSSMMENPMGNRNPSMLNNQMCNLTQAQRSTLLAECNSAPDTAGLKNRSGFCTCAISQVQFGACSDKAGLQKRIETYCSNY